MTASDMTHDPDDLDSDERDGVRFLTGGSRCWAPSREAAQ